MSEAKHSESIDYIGKTLPDGIGRDAIHIAVYPMVANRDMSPGTNVNDLGIVDPFLDRPVKAGERFFLFLKPQTIKSLRHVWTHPDIPNEQPNDTANIANVEESRQWLANFADRLGQFTVDELIETTRFFVEKRSRYDSSTICMGGDIDCYEMETDDEFWRHYEIATGTKVNRKDVPNGFRCAC